MGLCISKKAADSLGVHLTTVKGWVLDYRSEHGVPKSLEQVDQRKYIEQLERENRQRNRAGLQYQTRKLPNSTLFANPIWPLTVRRRRLKG